MATDPYLALRLALKARREALGWTQKDLAERLHMCQSAVSYLESGRGKRHQLQIPKWESLARWGKVLDVDILVLLRDGTVEFVVKEKREPRPC